MKSFLRFGGICVLILTSQIVLYAQQATETKNPWKYRATTLTDDLLTDAKLLAPSERALLFARLGDVWWPHDSTQARAWLETAIENLKSPSDAENSTDRHRRLTTARSILPLIIPKDKELSAKLAAIFAVDSDKANQSDRNDNTQALVNAALALVKTDPKRALELGSASLQAGRTPLFSSLLWELCRNEKLVGEALFREALKIAQLNFDRELLVCLVSVAFPNLQDPSAKGPLASDLLRASLLSALANGLQQPVASAEDETRICQLAPLAVPLLEQFYQFVPQQAGFVRAVLTRCQPTLPSQARQTVADSMRDLPLKTIEDYLEAGEKTSDLQMQTLYFMRAAFMASEQKNYDRAISILDNMKVEARKNLAETWNDVRSDFTYEAAIAHFKKGEFDLMRKVIANAPSELRPLVLVRLTEVMVDDDAGSMKVEYLNETRKELENAPPLQRVHAFAVLTQLYLKVMPSDAMAVFNEMAKAVNRADQVNSGELWQPISLSVSLLEIDEVGVRGILSSISKPTNRVSMRFGLLALVLEHWHRAEKPVAKSKDAASNDH